MATSVHTFNDNNKKIHWHEQYVSEGLNRKASAESHGIVRGFNLAAQAPAAMVDQFRLLRDAVKLDGVICLRNVDNRVITLLQDADITIDMSGVANGNYWICAWTDYSTGATTNALIYLLTTAELSLPAYSGKIVVIGWVKKDGITNLDPHPVAGVPNLGETNFAHVASGSPAARREIARNLDSVGHIEWQKMVRCGRADEHAGKIAMAFPYLYDWKRAIPGFVAAGTFGLMEVSDVDPYRGKLHFRVNMRGDGAGNPTIRLFHKCMTHVKGGDTIRFSMAYKVPAPVGAGAGGWAIGYGVAYFDKGGNIITVLGTVGALAAYDVAGAATAWTKIENETHVIDGRNIEYAVPYISILHMDVPVADHDFYFDDIEMEVLSSRGPQLDPTVDANEHVMQPVRSSVLTISDWIWDAFPLPTQAILLAWELYAAGPEEVGDPGRTLMIGRTVGPAGPPHPLVALPPFTGLKSGYVPGTANRNTLFRQNTPRAWATLRWPMGGPITLADGFGFASVAPLGVGLYRLTFNLDEDGNPWIGNLNYSISLGLMMQSGGGPWPGHMVTVEAKGANTLDIAFRVDGGAGVWGLADPPTVGDEIYVQVFAND